VLNLVRLCSPIIQNLKSTIFEVRLEKLASRKAYCVEETINLNML